ncbi:MAG: hypothetical protein ABI595_05280 [Actinomycetota bacterium]
MFRADEAMPVKVRREGRRTTTIQANVRDECAGLLSMTTKTGEGWWRPIVGDETATIYVMSQMPANNNDLALDYPFVVDPGRNSGEEGPTLVESARDLGKVVRSYGEDLDLLLAYLVEFASDVQG